MRDPLNINYRQTSTFYVHFDDQRIYLKIDIHIQMIQYYSIGHARKTQIYPCIRYNGLGAPSVTLVENCLENLTLSSKTCGDLNIMIGPHRFYKIKHQQILHCVNNWPLLPIFQLHNPTNNQTTNGIETNIIVIKNIN